MYHAIPELFLKLCASIKDTKNHNVRKYYYYYYCTILLVLSNLLCFLNFLLCLYCIYINTNTIIIFDFIDNYKLALVSDIKSFVQKICVLQLLFVFFKRVILYDIQNIKHFIIKAWNAMFQERSYCKDFGIFFYQTIIETFPLNFHSHSATSEI